MTGAEFFIWRVGTITVRVSLDLVDRLNAALAEPQRGATQEHGGILLGSVVSPGVIEIAGFEFQPSEHRRGVAYDLGARERSRVARYVAGLRKRSRSKPVGYFRTHLRPGLFLDQDDFSLMSESFADADSVALLIRPSVNSFPSAGFFFWEDGDIDRRQTRLAFALDAATLRERGPVERTPAELESAHPGFRFTWSPAVAAAMTALALAVAAVAIHRHPTADLPVVSPVVKIASTREVPIAQAPKRQAEAPAAPQPVRVAVPVEPYETIKPVYVESRPEVMIAPPPPPVQVAATLPQPAPIEAPVRLPPPPARPHVHKVSVAVTVEVKPSSEFKKVVSHVPLFGRVQGGDDFTPARPDRPLKPHVPEYMAADLSRELPIDVRVSIDKHGTVKDTELLTGRGTDFGSLAADSAGGVEWAPARKGDHYVASEVIVHYRFRPSTAE